MLADSLEDTQVSLLKRLVYERSCYRNTGIPEKDRKFFEEKDVKIVELIKKIDGTSHIYAGSAAFRQLKLDYIL